jgi:hypothetical protein
MRESSGVGRNFTGKVTDARGYAEAMYLGGAKPTTLRSRAFAKLDCVPRTVGETDYLRSGRLGGVIYDANLFEGVLTLW